MLGLILNHQKQINAKLIKLIGKQETGCPPTLNGMSYNGYKPKISVLK